ncbi:MAG: hypothetical protein J6I79_05160 [Paludibacteraceae bacterium]|nr:hypothetical protein [Paludibacteraceae bacterium]
MASPVSSVFQTPELSLCVRGRLRLPAFVTPGYQDTVFQTGSAVRVRVMLLHLAFINPVDSVSQTGSKVVFWIAFSASPPCNALYAVFLESCTKFTCCPCRLEDGISITGYGERTQSFRRAR